MVAIDVESAAARVDRLRTAIAQEFGAQAVSLGDSEEFQLDYLPLDIPCLDRILDGGFPKRRLTEISGDKSTGKTTLLLKAIAKAQKQGGLAGFIDLENSLDSKYATALGVDIEKLLVMKPETGEKAFQMAFYMLSENQFSVIALDSLTALDPEKNGKGKHANLVSDGLRTLTNKMRHSCSTVLVSNQLRRTGSGGSGKPKATGGAAVDYYPALRLELTFLSKVMQDKTPCGVRIRAESIKNKTANPFCKAEFEIIFGQGIRSIEGN